MSAEPFFTYNDIALHWCFRDSHSIYQLKHLLEDAKSVAIVGNGGIATELVY